MTAKKIRQTLTKEFVTWAQTFKIPFAVPNLEFEPVPGEEYLQLWFLDAAPVSYSLAEGHEQLQGIMQIDINVPYGEGEGRVLEIYESLNTVFKSKAVVRNSAGAVRLGRVYLSGTDSKSPWYTKFMTIEYSAFA